jgi:hypothetical protein
MRMRSVTLPLAAALVAVMSVGCMFNNKLQPLTGEDAKALSLSGERVAWLERTGASRAFEALRKALRTGEHGTVLALLGPDTRAAVRAQAARDGKDPEALLAAGKVEGMGLTGAPDPLATLAGAGDASWKEADPFDPARRAVRLRVKIGGGDEFVLPAVYTESGWRFELVRKDTASPGVLPPTVPGV